MKDHIIILNIIGKRKRLMFYQEKIEICSIQSRTHNLIKSIFIQSDVTGIIKLDSIQVSVFLRL